MELESLELNFENPNFLRINMNPTSMNQFQQCPKNLQK